MAMLRFIHLGKNPPPALMKFVVNQPFMAGPDTFIDVDGGVWNCNINSSPVTWTQLQLGNGVPAMKQCAGNGNTFIGVAMDDGMWAGSPWLVTTPPGGYRPIPIKRVNGAVKWVSTSTDWIWAVNDGNQIYCAMNAQQVLYAGGDPQWNGPVPGNLVNIAAGPQMSTQHPYSGPVFGANSEGRVFQWRGGNNFSIPNWDDMNFPDNAALVANAQTNNDGSHGVWVLVTSGRFWSLNTFHNWQLVSAATDYISFSGVVFVSRSGDAWIGTFAP